MDLTLTVVKSEHDLVGVNDKDILYMIELCWDRTKAST